jgi:hypothetical protein
MASINPLRLLFSNCEMRGVSKIAVTNSKNLPKDMWKRSERNRKKIVALPAEQSCHPERHCATPDAPQVVLKKSKKWSSHSCRQNIHQICSAKCHKVNHGEWHRRKDGIDFSLVAT